MMIRRIAFGIALLVFAAGCSSPRPVLDLSGQWTCRLDSLSVGEQEHWQNKLFEQPVQLPGTLDDAGLGTPHDLPVKFEKETLLHLTRKHRYVGAAWYSREVTIPGTWEGKNIALHLERVLWETRVWVDGKKAGMSESIVAPHEFDLTALLTPGKHILTMRIDNGEKYDVSHSTRNLAHAYTDHTQIMWNGVIGDITLHARDMVYIDDVQAYPDVDAGKVTVVTRLKNPSHLRTDGELTVTVTGLPSSAKQALTLSEDRQTFTTQYDLGKDFILWDEFNPHLYTLTVQLDAANGDEEIKDNRSVSFGMRKIGHDGNILQLNDRRIYLRGTLECAIFPLTGYPPMDKAGWKKIFDTAREYGLNHLRFHSWCPPEAAFQAADETGFYLQVELPLWSLTAGEDEQVNRFLEEEAARIIKAYGNHPSFCFWSMGNELQGNFDWITRVMTGLKQTDPRHLYTTTTFTFQKGRGLWPEPGDDFYVAQYTKKGWVRGQGIFDTAPPSFDKDYSASIDSMPVPLISHEIGQYAIYPDMQEIGKYTGVLEPLNFRAIKQDLAQKNLLDDSPGFSRSSGKFAVELYKEEIERALKTPGISGFQLLDLHDFPGQGTALIGILDAFWESKGLITPEEFRQFCSPVVPLIRYEKAVYDNTGSFEATAEIANFSSRAWRNAVPVWKILARDGKELASGTLPATDIPVGNGISLGDIRYDLSAIKEATTLTVEVSIRDTPYRNTWRIWVYPAQLQAGAGDVVVTQSLNDALRQLAGGKKVFLNPPLDSVRGIEGKFVPVFWSPIHFPDQPGSMGLLCDPSHPALKDFPTAGHSDWQWWYLCKNSKPMLLSGLDVDPVIQVIDNFFKNRLMGDLVEATVGDGRLMLCSIDLTALAEQRPEARQLKYSILRYMNSDAFNPQATLTEQELRRLVVTGYKK